MKTQEQKYRVEGFDEVLPKLQEADAVLDKKSASAHYYARLKTNDVVKLVVHDGDKAEIHKLKEQSGNFALTESIPVADTPVGLAWFKQQGYKTLDLVHMVHSDYGYKDGVVVLYIINGFLHSVILDYPAGEHEAMEAELGLGSAERIDVPYNKYLERIGKSQSIELD